MRESSQEITKIRESSFNMTSGGEDIEGGGGGSKNFKTPERGALKKLLAQTLPLAISMFKLMRVKDFSSPSA